MSTRMLRMLWPDSTYLCSGQKPFKGLELPILSLQHSKTLHELLFTRIRRRRGKSWYGSWTDSVNMSGKNGNKFFVID
jgi:hypothetical protein